MLKLMGKKIFLILRSKIAFIKTFGMGSFIQWTINLIFGLHLPLLPHFTYARSEGSGETEHMPRFVRVFTARHWDKARIFY